MRVYFYSKRPAAVRLDGEYAGTADMFARYADIGERGTFAEILPHDNGVPLNFFIDEKFFSSAHAGMATVLAEDEGMLYFEGFESKGGLEVSAQGAPCGTLVTVFRLGTAFAACEGAGYAVHRLPEGFSRAQPEAAEIEGRQFTLLRGEGAAALFYGEKLAFCGRADGIETGCGLKITENLASCARYVREREYAFDGEKFVVKGSRVAGRAAPAEGTEHIAFFESVLYGGDCARYMCPELAKNCGALKEYLGGFCAVTPPTERALARYGDRTAGLVYRVQEGLYRVKYFSAEVQGGLITNIFPAE